VDHDFTQESGELTPTLKVKRKFCTQRFAALLEGMYDEKLL
jgi:long-chain acyl-CoA synthetase